ncbi:hypothetical protein C8J56DRAFT_908912 [Mycena floridula]|nr:hypothetical protein C8J56DRAFT_908912 [Mycena floridula]
MMISTKMALGCRVLTLALLYLPALCLILETPYSSTQGVGSSILSNGFARIDWIPAANGSDPVIFNVELKNNVTGDSYELAQQVATDMWTTIVRMTDVVPGIGYFIQAVNISHHSQVYNSSAIFTVAGATPSNPASSPVVTVYYYFNDSLVTLKPHQIVGIVLGTVIGLALLLGAVAWLVRHRYKRKDLAEKSEYPFQSVSQSQSAPVTANPGRFKLFLQVFWVDGLPAIQSPMTAQPFSPISPERELPPVSESKE